MILASGLDSRAYRLQWPAGTVVYEIDQPKVIEFKTATMAAIGATPTAERRAVSIDLREDWPAALRRSGFDDSQPTAWSAEGLLVYLPPEAQDRLFDDITALSAPGSRLATEYHPDAGASIGERAAAMRDRWQQHGFDVNLADLFYQGERNHVVDYLTEHGWQVTARTRPDMFADYGRDFPDSEELAPMRDSLAVTATRTVGEPHGTNRQRHAGIWPPAWAPPPPRWPHPARWPRKRPDALLDDPFAEPLVRAVGLDALRQDRRRRTEFTATIRCSTASR